MSQLQLEISSRYDPLTCPARTTKTLIRSIETSGEFPIATGDLSIAFVTDKEIAEVHKTFMGDPAATDVITFPADLAMNFAGEIIVSVDHAINQARTLNEPFSRELSLYLIHGWLHLAGYDDHSNEDCKRMRKAEQKALEIVSRALADDAFTLKG